MATLADLKTRIVTETSRSDLEDELADQLLLHIQRACEFYASEKFWFNSIITTAPTVGGTQTVNVPATVRRVDKVTIPALDIVLNECTLADFDDYTLSGVPWAYAYYNDALRLYPTPDAAYTLQITGLAQVDAPTDDADTSIWTDEAQDLIVARTKFTLFRGQFRDPEGAQLANAEVQEAFARLKNETAKRLVTPLRSRRTGRTYNINVE